MNKLLPWLVLGIILRLVIIPSTLHPDIRGYNYGAFLVSSGHIFDFYDYLGNLPKEHPLVSLFGVNLFIYPPLAYLYPAIFMKVFSPIFPLDLFNTLLLDMWEVLGNPKLPLLLYLLKLPYFVADMFIVWLVGQYFTSKKEKLLSRILWLLNPVVIYSTYMISQFDVLIALAILGTLILSLHHRFFIAAAVLSLGASVKQFPLFLLPILALNSYSTFGKKLAVFITGLIVYLLVLLPYLPSVGFRRYALLASQTDKIFFAKIPLSGGEFLPLFLVGLFLVYWFCSLYNVKYQLWQWMILPLLLFYSLVHFHPQWFTWVTPILIIFLVKLWPRGIYPISVLMLSYFGLVFMFEPSLNVGLFEPVNPPWNRDFSLIPAIANFFPEITARSIFASLFAGSSFIILFLSSRKVKSNGKN